MLQKRFREVSNRRQLAVQNAQVAEYNGDVPLIRNSWLDNLSERSRTQISLATCPLSRNVCTPSTTLSNRLGSLMEHPGNSKQIAVNVVPLLVASGIMLGTPAAVIAAAAPHAAALTTIMAGLGINLVSSGLAALCKPRRLLAGREYENLVANHDILRLVRTAWGDAAASAVQNYSESHPVSTLISLFAQRPDEFLKILEAVDPEDFIPEEISASTIREAIDASRRSLASPSAQEMNSKYVKNLNSALIGAVIDAVSRKLPSDLKLPSDFRPFLAGEDPRLPGGILGQLCIYVALHLKTDTRAQVAVLHLTLQDVSDDLTDMKQAQQQIEDLCKRIYASANQSQTVLLAAFENKIKDLSANIQTQLDEAFNHSIRPQLDRPFANASADTLASFTLSLPYYSHVWPRSCERCTPPVPRRSAPGPLDGDQWACRHWEKPHCSRTDRHGPNSNSRLSKGTHRLLAGRILEKPLMDQGRRTQVESGCRHIDSHRLCGPTRPKGSCHFPSRP